MNLGTNFRGWSGSQVITDVWHKGPTMTVSGTATFSRSSASDKNVSYDITISSTIYGGSYGYPVTACVVFGGNRIQISNSYSGTTYYGNASSGGTSYGNSGVVGEVPVARSGGEGTKTFQGSVECTDNNTNIDVVIWCNGGGTHDCDSETWGHPNIIVGSTNTDYLTHYNPHSNPEIEVGDAGQVWSRRERDRNVSYRYKTDGHGATIKLSSEGSGFTVAGSSDWTDWENRSFNPAGCGQPYDAKYRVSGDITDNNDTRYTGHTDGPTLYCYGSLKCSLGSTPPMIKGRASSIPVTAGKDVFENDDNHISYGFDVKRNSEDDTHWQRYTINADAGSGRNTYTDSANFTPTTDGDLYNIRAWVRHNVSKEEWYHTRNVKTYVDPVLSDISGSDIFSPQDLATYSWTNNANAITNAGETPLQQITIANSSKDEAIDSSTSINLAPSGTYWVQNIFSDIARSVNVLSSTLTVKFTNSDSGVSVSKDKQFQVQYQPTQNITDVSVENQGRTIAIDADADTKVQWKYPWDVGSAGVVSGFRIRVYADSNYSTLVSTKEVSVTYADFITGPIYSINLNNETDLQRGVMNYADITPYYIYPNGGTKSYGPVVQVGQLIKPYKYMAKPAIEYPINNKIWHNNGFRVLFRLNEDRDYSTYSSTIQNAYKYSDVEIKVNNTVYSFSGTYTGSTAHSEIFSTDVNKNNTNNYQKYMSINPSLVSGFPDVADGSNFKISIRVQRGNYYFTNQEMQGQDSLGTAVKTWSDWSDEITLNKSSIAPQNLAVGMEIKASHYQAVHNWGLRLLECYPLEDKDSRDIDQVRGDKIEGSQPHPEVGEYLGIYNTILNLIAGVNGYCIYDRDAVKFNINETFIPATEIITSAESGTDRYGSTGRNYMNLLTRYMIDYLK